MTPLHLAGEGDALDVATVLLSHDAERDAINQAVSFIYTSTKLNTAYLQCPFTFYKALGLYTFQSSVLVAWTMQ